MQNVNYLCIYHEVLIVVRKRGLMCIFADPTYPQITLEHDMQATKTIRKMKWMQQTWPYHRLQFWWNITFE